MYNSPQLEPYLGPRAQLSLAWLSHPLLSLLLVFVALCFILNSIPPLVDDAKHSLEAACAGVEGTANVAVSLPHYMAHGVNELNVKAAEGLISGTRRVIDLLLIAITQIVLFAIDVYKSLFLCLMDLVVHGSLTLLIEATEEIDRFIATAFQGIRTGLQKSVEGINVGLDKTLGLIDKIPGIDFDIPQIDVPDLTALSNVTLPDSILRGLESLNDTIPTLDELKTTVDTAISTPMNELRAQVNSTLANRTIEFDTLPVPARQTVSVCADLDTAWVDHVGRDLSKFVRISLALIAVAAVILVLACAYLAHRRHRAFLQALSIVRSSWLSSLSPLSPPSETLNSSHLVTHHSALSNPLLTRFLHWLYPFDPARDHRRARSRARVAWFLFYICNPTAIAIFIFGLFGLVVVQIQLWALRGPIAKLARSRAEDGANDFSSSVAQSVNAGVESATTGWETDMNGRLAKLEADVNDDMLKWVGQSTSTVNTTINDFYDGVTGSITKVFNGTVLQDPVLGLVYCLIGSKVSALSTAMTWLHDNVHLTLPRASASVFQLSEDQTAELASSMTDPNSAVSAPNLVERMIESYAKNLEQSRLGFAIAMSLWGIVLVMGAVAVFWDWWRQRKQGDTVAQAKLAYGGEKDHGLKPIVLQVADDKTEVAQADQRPRTESASRPQGVVASKFAHAPIFLTSAIGSVATSVRSLCSRERSNAPRSQIEPDSDKVLPTTPEPRPAPKPFRLNAPSKLDPRPLFTARQGWVPLHSPTDQPAFSLDANESRTDWRPPFVPRVRSPRLASVPPVISPSSYVSSSSMPELSDVIVTRVEEPGPRTTSMPVANPFETPFDDPFEYEDSAHAIAVAR